MTFLFEFYNYARHVQNNCRVGEQSDAIKALNEAVDEAGLSTLNSMKSSSNPEYRGTKQKAGGDGDQGRINDRNKEREQMEDALQKAGFKVQNTNYGPDLTAIPKVRAGDSYIHSDAC